MPFAKRTVEPQRLCRSASPGADPEDLRAVSNAALSRTVRQLSDLARHAGSLFHELERELAATDRRLRDLRERVRRMDRSTEQLDPKLEAVRECGILAPVCVCVCNAVCAVVTVQKFSKVFAHLRHVFVCLFVFTSWHSCEDKTFISVQSETHSCINY